MPDAGVEDEAMKMRDALLIGAAIAILAGSGVLWSLSGNRAPLDPVASTSTGSASPARAVLELESPVELPAPVVEPPAALQSEPARTEIVESAEQKLRRLRAEMQQHAIDEKWADAYAAFPPDPQAVEAEVARLETRIVELVRAHMEGRFATGDFVFVRGSSMGATENPYEIRWSRSEPGSAGWKVVVASEGTCAEAYRLRARGLWLRETKLGRVDSAVQGLVR